MGNIVLLDELTINKIAAGEVVERPASVIKEMVENSIDAGATNINIEIKNGGISYIRITDNGKGISSDDMELAFERHATSKIRNANDINDIKSMGFRGEALASIAAIANVEMITRNAEADVGNRIVVEAGKILEKEEKGCPIGTTITVQNLFFNTPVRYKFLKKDYTESGYMEDVVSRLALINPSISFKLVNTGKTIVQTSGNGNVQDVIYAIYGRDIAGAILNVDYIYENMHVTGVVGKPEIARSNRSNQLFFVNKRYVKDKTLSGAAENSFKGLLPIGKYGFLILNIDIDPSKVDVNVHPAKLEVRFEEDNKVFKAIYHAIRDTLLKAELIANIKEDNEDQEAVLESSIKSEIINPNFSNLFRKISNNFGDRNNFTKDIYNKEHINNLKENNIQQNEETTDHNEIVDTQSDNFKEPIDIPDQLEQEVEKENDINTDQLINQTEMTEAKIVNDTQEFQTEEQKFEEETDSIDPNIYNNKEDLTETEMKPEEQKTEIDIQEDSQQELDEQIEQIRNAEDIDNTKSFTNEQIQEMIHKLNNMKDLEENPEFEQMYKTIFGKLPASVEEKKKEEEEKINAYQLIKDNNISVFEEMEEYNNPTYKFIGIAFKTYIIIEIENEMYIIDQHAAHERIMYEKVKKNYYTDGNKDSQMLLLPDIITLTHKEMDIARENFEMFEKAGFTLEEFGDNTIKLTGVPNICLDLDTKELFLETLDQINTVARTAKEEIEEKFIATVACKAAVKANMALDAEEVDNLMNDLLKLPNPFTCPHGRPTAIKMNKNDIEKKFARRK